MARAQSLYNIYNNHNQWSRAIHIHKRYSLESYRKHAHPMWCPPITTSIPKDKDTVAELVTRCSNRYRIYMDRSMTNGGIGAAAVLERKSLRMSSFSHTYLLWASVLTLPIFFHPQDQV